MVEYDHGMRAVKRVLLVFSGFVAVVAYLWVAAVRNLPEVRRRKVQRRAR
jgi:hypothetical protein